ncbi:MAG: hypothetical protein AAGF23_24985, partial [Acidobacteriota bacterium]
DLARRLRDLLRRRDAGARERALPPGVVEDVVAALDGGGFSADVRRFTYWPYVCGYLPEGLAWPLMRFLDAVKSARRGDAVKIEARRGAGR